MLLFFLIFGVVSVSYFKGKMFDCISEHVDIPKINEVQSKWDCLDGGGEWVNKVYTFDNTPNAMVTLFVMSTTAGWAEVSMRTSSTTTIDYVSLPLD